MSWQIRKTSPWPGPKVVVRVEESDGRITLFADTELTPREAEDVAKVLVEAAKRSRSKRPH